MNKLLLTDNPLISVWVYPERKIVQHVMKAYCHGPLFRDALATVVDGMERYKAVKYLSDNRLGGAVTNADAEWAGKFFSARALAAGWRLWAIVQPASVIGQINMKRHATATVAYNGVDSRVFVDADEAMRWLDES